MDSGNEDRKMKKIMETFALIFIIIVLTSLFFKILLF